MLQVDQEMDEIFGTYEVGRGEAPKGVSAASALMLLDERARQGQGSLYENWSMGFLEWGRQHLNIWREYADEERNLATDLGSWSIEKFNKAKLQGSIDLKVEIGENRPHTIIGRRAAVDQAVRLGVVNIMDPQVAFKLLQLLGLPELMEDYKQDQRAANKVVDGFISIAGAMKQGIPPEELDQIIRKPAPWDNHQIMVMIIRRFLLSDKFEEMPIPLQNMVIQRMQFHFDMLVQSAAQARLGPGQVAPGPAGGGDGTAEGDGAAGTDQEQMDREVQGATPDQMTGGAASGLP